MKRSLQTPRGMHDIVSDARGGILKLYTLMYEWSTFYSFDYIATPLVEAAMVFERSAGVHSDVVEKEMFYLSSREEGEKFVLRPEGTAPVCRAYIQHGMHVKPQPVKLFYLGPMFRRERPQAGRYRQHTQWGLEVLGSDQPIYDAHLIDILYRFLIRVGVKKVLFHVNSIGCRQCRPKLKEELKKAYRFHLREVCSDCRRRFKTSPFRLLDCKNAKCQSVKTRAPMLIDFLCQECHDHFHKVLEYLEVSSIPYELDNTLVRGFDYYSRTVFEVLVGDGGGLALGGGGRYDYLVEMLGGKPTPAAGWGFGIERLWELLAEGKDHLVYRKPQQVFLVQIGEEARKVSFKLLEEFRRADLRVAESIGKNSLRQQLELADVLKVQYVLILGQKEVGEKLIILRDMETGAQENIPIEKVIEEVKKRL